MLRDIALTLLQVLKSVAPKEEAAKEEAPKEQEALVLAEENKDEVAAPTEEK